MNAEVLTMILTVSDILIDSLAPVPEMAPELKAQFRAELQKRANLGEAWLENELNKLKEA